MVVLVTGCGQNRSKHHSLSLIVVPAFILHLCFKSNIPFYKDSFHNVDHLADILVGYFREFAVNFAPYSCEEEDENRSAYKQNLRQTEPKLNVKLDVYKRRTTEVRSWGEQAG